MHENDSALKAQTQNVVGRLIFLEGGGVTILAQVPQPERPMDGAKRCYGVGGCRGESSGDCCVGVTASRFDVWCSAL